MSYVPYLFGVRCAYFWGRYFRNISAVSSDCKMYMEFSLYFPQKSVFLLWKMQ